ncbi:hypothetical protein CY35_17G058300 [Sphagnum magellanicum]|nr:hypothetical protein CY35_17G058300 [Sphagnum magellanicum]
MGFMIPAVMKKKLRPSFGTLRFMVVLIAVVVPAFLASHGNGQCLNPSPELLFYRGAIIPDVIQSVPCEFQQLQIYYPGVISQVSFNQSLFQNQTSAAPHVEVLGAGGVFLGCYTLLMVDPDAPSLSEIIHWIVTDIPWDLSPLSDKLYFQPTTTTRAYSFQCRSVRIALWPYRTCFRHLFRGHSR